MAFSLVTVALVDLLWLEVVPTAFDFPPGSDDHIMNIGWRFYLCFIILSLLFAIICFCFFPNSRGLAIEEMAVLFGDDAEVYQIATPEDRSEAVAKDGGAFVEDIKNA
ncbi:uncharacterized protein Z519_07389 [Cladophialophora bantiana CBS 173.52]|uniref:Major facilitator superfamily (MFS) profile domain-containing protein n=1 Tax=Cladophialophora bantiana (strain ATCC 10958 / CBS 173.52 / CDC B-1940 / NIH 8579) TaxID=1442370 RepID=A0A0D2HNH0_CLAB1|nr:uncharacterized protein Z519_07389 [Cladophialophora bantiana CBS 173.52]KIW92405.1 hypothetical protein Z519_07389 [Cladophialophora bantiana CBS 173.52]